MSHLEKTSGASLVPLKNALKGVLALEQSEAKKTYNALMKGIRKAEAQNLVPRGTEEQTRKTFQRLLKGAREKKMNTISCSNISLGKIQVAQGKISPKAFFQTRNGLDVSVDFETEILSVAGPIKNFSAWAEVGTCIGDDIATNFYPKKGVWEPSEFCAFLAGLLNQQEEGGDIPYGLRSGGFANIFFVRGIGGYISSVNVNGDKCCWHLTVRRHMSGKQWAPGARVFEPAG